MKGRRTRAPRALWRTAWVGEIVGVVVGALVALAIISTNPVFFDHLPGAIVLFLVLPALAGWLIGLAVAAFFRKSGPRGARLGGPIVTACGLLLLFILDYASAQYERNPPTRLDLLVVGVDGATWNIIDQLAVRGELPTFARLRAEGASGTCLSLLPMFSNRVFTSIATGKVAEKHGIVGLSDTAERLKAARLWDILGARRWVTGTMEWYVTWPPEERERGFTVPDLYARSAATTPPELRFLRELRIRAKAGRGLGPWRGVSYGVALVKSGLRLSTLLEGARFYLDSTGGRLDPRELYYRQHYLWTRLETDVFCGLVAKYDLNFGAVVFKVTDSLGHKYWKYYEPDRFAGVTPEDVARFREVIPGAYRLVDTALARLARRVAPDGAMAVISDHGFQSGAQTEKGISTLRTETLLKLLGLRAQGWEYVNIGGAACLMLRGAAGEGGSEEDRARASREVVETFRNARLVGDGLAGAKDQPVFLVDVEDRPGAGDDYVAVGIRPEVVERLVVGGGGAPVGTDLQVEFPGGERAPLRDLVVISELSGDHAVDGILILHGAGVQGGVRLADCSVLDLTPTLLALEGLPVGADMDGRVLVEALQPERLTTHPVTTVPTYDTPQNLPRLTAQPEDQMTAEQIEQLRSLGYMQ